RVLIVQRIICVDVQSIRDNAAGNLLAQHAAYGSEVQRVGELVTETAQAFLVGALPAEEDAVDQRLQPDAQRIEENSDQKDQSTDQVWIIGRHGDRKDQAESTDQ